MRYRRALSLVAIAILLPALPGSADSHTGLDRARREARAAESDLATARSQLAAAESYQAGVEQRLTDALVAYAAAAAELERLALSGAELRRLLEQAEAATSRLAASAQDRAVEAYMRAVTGPAGMLVAAGSLEEAAVAAESLDALGDGDTHQLAQLAEERVRLAALRSEFRAAELDARRATADLDARSQDLSLLLADAGEEVLAAYQGLEAADDRYRQALTTLDQEERKRARLVGVEHWRPLVADYFPAGRVEEALRVMACESRGNPDANHPTSDAAGLFQFLAGTWAFASVQAGFGGASRYDPEANIAAAAWLVEYSIATRHPGGAWGHWVCQP